jgi:hypothetical protein
VVEAAASASAGRCARFGLTANAWLVTISELCDRFGCGRGGGSDQGARSWVWCWRVVGVLLKLGFFLARQTWLPIEVIHFGHSGSNRRRQA